MQLPVTPFPPPSISWVQKFPSEPVLKHPQFVFFCSSPHDTAKNLKKTENRFFCLVPLKNFGEG
jgi:hypothetical protein